MSAGHAHETLEATMAGLDASLRGLGRAERVTTRPLRSDAALVRDARRGSADAWSALFERHWPSAYRAAYLVLHDAAAAEDVTQEAFLAALAALDRFDRRRPFAPWLHRIAVNRAIDHARAAWRRHELASDRVPETPSDSRDDGDSARLLAALATLTPDHRAVVVLRHLLDWTPGEIAASLGLPRGTVNSRLRRALDSLGAELEGGDRDGG